MLRLASLVYVTCWLGVVHTAWMTEYDKQFQIECPAGEYLQKIESTHDNRKEDRVFNFYCARVNSTELHISDSCEWTEYVNDFDELFEFQCWDDNVIAGVSSYHDNHDEDRRFKFLCCKPAVTDAAVAVITHSCNYTDWLNDFDKPFSYSVPDGWVLRGVISVHNNRDEDRRFKLDICQLATLRPEPSLIIG